MQDDISREILALKDILQQARSVAVLTGAGVSAESDIPTFRGPGGWWRNLKPEELATPEAFTRNPSLVWEWYDWRRQIIASKNPNPAHFTLVRLEAYYPQFLLITQNIDGLHQKAGSKKVIELHGNIWRVRCVKEGLVSENREVPLSIIPPRCSCGALLRPDVVWFGEALSPNTIEQSIDAVRDSEVLLVVGTSAVVQPAASLPIIAKDKGKYVIEINNEPTPISTLVDKSLMGKAGEILPRLASCLDIE
jgi:NAD-dependent deacetylase